MILKSQQFRGIVPRQPYHIYRADPSVANSDIGLCEHSMLSYAYWTGDQTPKKTSSTVMELGTIVHKRVLEPGNFEKDCLFMPEGVTLVHKAGKELRKQAEAEDKILVRRNHFEIAEGIYRHLLEHETYSPYFLCGGNAEVACYARLWGLECKGLVDWLPNTGGCMIDVKTSGRLVTKWEMARQIEKLKYYRQFAFYRAILRKLGMTVNKVFVLAIETDPPYHMKMYEIPEPLLLAGEDEARRWIEAIKQCMATRNWPGYPQEIERIDCPDITPAWAYEKAGEKPRLINR